MNTATGFGISAKQDVSGGGAPFPVGSAANGLSVDPDNGKIVLGNDVINAPGNGQLLSPRQIYMQGNSIDLVNNAEGRHTLLTGDEIFIQDNAFENFLEMNNQILSLRTTALGNNLNAGINGNTIGVSDFNTGLSIGFTQEKFNLVDSSGGGGFRFVGGVLQIIDSGSNTDVISINTNTSTPATMGNLAAKGSIKTGDPAAAAGAWKLGAPIAAAVTLDTTRYIEVSINGTIVKLAVVV